MVRLGDVATIKMGQSPPSDTYNSEGVGLPFFQGKADFGFIHPSVRMYCSKPQKTASANDVLISVRAPVGTLNIANTECCIGRGLAAITEIDEVSLSKFIYYSLENNESTIKSMGTGSTFKAINKTNLESIFLRLPPLSEQRRIINALDLINEKITLRRAQLEKLDLLIKSQFIEMFGDPVTNPMGWEVKRLGKTCSITTGNTPPRANPENYGDFIEWIKTDNIQDLSLSQAVEYLSEKGFERCRYVEAGSILMTCIAGSLNSIGNVAATNRRVAFNQQINALTPREYESLFLLWLLKLMKKTIHGSVNMMLKGILSKGTLSEITAIVPPLPLQIRFADFVCAADKSKFEIRQALEKLETLNKALMQEYFS